MFKGKVYLYKNINWKEEKVEKEFDKEDEFNKYVEWNPELKKLNTRWEEIKTPGTFNEMRKFFLDFDKKFFWDLSKQDKFFAEVEDDFKKLFDKSKKLLK